MGMFQIQANTALQDMKSVKLSSGAHLRPLYYLQVLPDRVIKLELKLASDGILISFLLNLWPLADLDYILDK